MPRTNEQLQADLQSIMEEVVEVRKEAEAKGYTSALYWTSAINLNLSHAKQQLHRLADQLKQEQADAEPAAKLEAMQREAGAFAQVAP